MQPMHVVQSCLRHNRCIACANNSMCSDYGCTDSSQYLIAYLQALAQTDNDHCNNVSYTHAACKISDKYADAI